MRVWAFVAMTAAMWGQVGEPRAQKIERFPGVAVVGQYRVTARIPDDPERRALGGSGGPMLDITVQDRRTGKRVEFETQGWRVVVEPKAEGMPEVRVWTKSSVTLHVRCDYRFEGGVYCMRQCAEYEQGEKRYERNRTPVRRMGCEAGR
ncbi:MAG: hypothetical protein J0L64_23520 [Acidobacteria bacterium]|nr:hypothetical protein [Acidobacteriota bacterium]